MRGGHGQAGRAGLAYCADVGAAHAALRRGDGWADERRRGETEFYVSDRVEDFERTASLFLQEDLRHTARRIDIERY